MADQVLHVLGEGLGGILRIARREFQGFFASPTAFIFLGAFLGVVLFTFFWVDTFFARNIADVRPLFAWMPMLLIFLVSAITMRMWSEERRAGTLELLLTAPVPPAQLVFGKFLACLALVAVALLLTLPLPFMVSQLGLLDWGPVLGGYIAALFLAGAYISIGLFVSARSENAMVSLIATALLCGVFYAIGSDALTGLFDSAAGEWLKLLGSGARFESITRGVIDLRDLYYYASLVGVFLTLNVLVLEWIRWAGNPSNPRHRRWALFSALMVANFAVGNVWLAQVGWARADITQGNIYSISDATRRYLEQLREPLLMRGYFSAQTHPLLAPLVPRLRDLLQEYAEAGDGAVRVEFIDPLENPELEQEAGEKFGIRPVPFQTADKYQASVVNSYFDVLVQYGDEYETLNFWDFIEVKTGSETEVEVELRNPEYDITRAIKKVLYAYQGAGDLFENIRAPITFRGYVSPTEKLPASLATLRGELEDLLDGIAETSQGKLTVEFVDPDAGDGALAGELGRTYGFRPMVAGLTDRTPFWFYLMLYGDDQVIQVPFPEDASLAGLERSVNSALKRFSVGLLRTVALYTPPPDPQTPPNPQLGPQGAPQGGLSFTFLRDVLQREHTVQPVDLSSGQLPAEADLLLLVAPKDLDEKQLFAVDQFLMQGGTVVVSTSPFAVDMRRNLATEMQTSGVEEWLRHHGVDVAEKLVLDLQNAALPIPRERRLGAIVIRETRMLDYPYFVDVRGSGLDRDSGLTGGLQQITIYWPSPIEIDDEKNGERRVTRLLESSAGSWWSESLDVLPNLDAYGDLGFPVGEDRAPQLLAAVVEGRFDSYFGGRDSPLLAAAEEFASPEEDAAAGDAPTISRVIDKSPESARLVVFASNAFLSDEALGLASQGLRQRYQNPIQLVANAVDWSFEDRGLLAIRGRAQFSRTLDPVSRTRQMIWEYANYGVAAVGLLLLWVLRKIAERARRRRYATVLNPTGA